MRVYQVDSNNLFLSSIQCSSTIYLSYFSSTTYQQRQPYFLSNEYSVVVDNQYVSKSNGLVKVEAVSMNPRNFMPIVYSIVDTQLNELFVIDSIQGFIYPRYDKSIPPKIYIFQVNLQLKIIKNVKSKLYFIHAILYSLR